MEFHNYLINEKFLRDKEKELFYIEFLNMMNTLNWVLIMVSILKKFTL